MNPCKVSLCPALATNGEFCPIHAAEALTLICAWCKTVLRQGTTDAPASHGICPECMGKVAIQMAEESERRAAVAARTRIDAMYHRSGPRATACGGAA